MYLAQEMLGGMFERPKSLLIHAFSSLMGAAIGLVQTLTKDYVLVVDCNHLVFDPYANAFANGGMRVVISVLRSIFEGFFVFDGL